MYTLENEALENIVIAVKLKAATRQTYMAGAFVSYHIVKSILWRVGYFAKFFYRTRFFTFPILIYGLFWNIKRTIRDLDDAGVLDYNTRRVRLDKDSYVVEKLLKNRLDF